MRTFIAIELSDEAKTALIGAIAELKPQFPKRAVRWVRREQLHLTLAFLGETAVSKLPALRQTLNQCASQQEPFQLRFSQMGCFPNCKRPRVLWIGLGGDLAPLQRLQKQLTTGLQPLGWQPEKRPYSPHLTLGRVKDGRLLSQTSWQQPKIAPTAFTVETIHLIESDLKPTGAVYSHQISSRLGN